METKKQKKIWINDLIHYGLAIIVVLIVVISLNWFGLLPNFIPSKISHFNPDAGDVCTEMSFTECEDWSEWVVDEDGTKTSDCIKWGKRDCFKWLSKEEKLQQDVTELKQWKDSIKEECVDNVTNYYFNYSTYSEVPRYNKKDIILIGNSSTMNGTDDMRFELEGNTFNFVLYYNFFNETICNKKILVKGQ